jgi:hypothetical protein
MSIDAPTRVVVLVAVLLAAAAAAFALLVLGHSKSSPSTAPPVTPIHHPVTKAVTPKTTPATPQVTTPKLLPGLPKPVAYALAHHPVVVVGLYEHRTGDGGALNEARAGAALAHTNFLALDVLQARYAGPIAGFTGSLADPGVVVIRRPGLVVRRLDGYHDRTVVAQAAHDAH